jgi:CheY-like chemotaxis protein
MLTTPNDSLAPPIALLVDPDMDTREIYEVWLRGRRLDAVHTANGRTALTLALHVEFALVISEIRLPDLDGPSLCRHLRQRPATSSVPILVVTADARRAALDRCMLPAPAWR